jgi:CubicO group peptidase (beta-lactamase class C family)
MAEREILEAGRVFVREPARVLPADEYLVRHRPRRVRPPGREAVYSNYSVALLGAVVAHVSGMR